jgi:predicted kinase
MPSNEPVLHMICGKIASGKSTLAKKLSAADGAVRISEDEWLATLFGDQMHSIPDFVRCSAKLRQAMEPHILALLEAGVPIVLDFQANTLSSRAWLRSLADQAGVAHVLHYLEVSDVVCKARLAGRNASGGHEFSVSDEQFVRITEFFVPPVDAEGFNLRIYRVDDVLDN